MVYFSLFEKKKKKREKNKWLPARKGIELSGAGEWWSFPIGTKLTRQKWESKNEVVKKLSNILVFIERKN